MRLSADGNTALIGALDDAKRAGAAFLFTRSEGKWAQQGAKLTGGKEESGEGLFGIALALSATGSTALISGWPENSVWVFASGLSTEEGYGCENPGEPNIHWSCIGGTVNSATGNHVETQTDLAVGGRGPGLRETRTYNSQLAAQQSKAGPLGFGWTGSYSAGLVVNEKAETATVHQDNGSAVTFTITPVKTYVGVGSWVQSTLVKVGANSVYTLPNQTNLTFNGSGQLTSETDRNENSVKLTYNKEGLLESATDGAERKLTFAYKEGQLASVKDPLGHTVSYTYDKAGNLASVAQPGEEAIRWKFGYDSSHQMTSETDAREHTTKTEYDSSHRVISQIDPLERKRTWKLTATETGTATTVTEPNASTTVMLFNNVGLPTSVTLASGTSIAATTTYEYDGSYDTIAVTDPDKHTTKYGYSAAGDLTSVTDPNNNETKWTYDGKHDVETMTTPKGETTTIAKRDSHGNPKVVERPAPNGTQKTTYKYDGQGDLESETDPLERTRTYTYDKYGDRESETDAAGGERSWTYNEDSQEISTVSPLGNNKGAEKSRYTTKLELDPQGRPLTVTNQLGHTLKYSYDGNGNLETSTDGNSHKTTYVYNADDQQTAVKEPNGTITETGYDSAGQITSQTDGNKHTTKYVRNALEEVTDEVDPRERKTTDEYDAAGQLKITTDPAKRTTTYTYDPGNRLTEVSYSDGKTHGVKHEYDKDGNVTLMTDGTGKTSYEYDQIDRLTSTTNGNGETVAYEYDLANEPTKITYPSKNSVTRTYDNVGRLESVTDWLKHTTKFTYNLDSDLLNTKFPSETGNEDKYVWDEADQPSETIINKGTERLAQLKYKLDSNGQLKKTASTGLPGEETIEDTYDENNRLTKAGSTEYEYDAANDPKKLGANTGPKDCRSSRWTAKAKSSTYTTTSRAQPGC